MRLYIEPFSLHFDTRPTAYIVFDLALFKGTSTGVIDSLFHFIVFRNDVVVRHDYTIRIGGLYGRINKSFTIKGKQLL